MSFIDLFCGIGGFHCALTGLGARCVLACDIDEKCRTVYEENWGIRPHADIRALRSEDIPDFDILCGGFPCQAFSHAGKQGGFEDTRGTLFQEIARILRDKQPRYYLLENVKNLRGHDGGRTLMVIQSTLKEAGYTPYPDLVCISPHHLGVPQHRERVFLLGVRNDLCAGRTFKPWKAPKKVPTDIRDVLEQEEKGKEEKGKEEIGALMKGVLDCWEEFLQGCKERGIRLPTFPVWTEWFQAGAEAEVEAVEKMPKWKQAFIKKNQEFYQANKAFLEPWLLKAREQKGFEGAKAKFEWQCGPVKEGDSLWNLLFTFRPSGIRVKRGDYSPALVAMAQIVYVGERGRKLSPREVCRLQSFPESFKIPASASVAYKQFGNSVNVRVVEEMARFLVGMLAE
jgi:DNA (cytosine-5)-methyltransferase 1